MSFLFLQGITAGSEEEREILMYLRSNSKKVEFPKTLLKSVEWDKVTVTEEAKSEPEPTPNGLLPLPHDAVYVSAPHPNSVSVPQPSTATNQPSGSMVAPRMNVSPASKPPDEEPPVEVLPASVPPTAVISNLSANAPEFVPRCYVAPQLVNGLPRLPPNRVQPASTSSYPTNQVSGICSYPGLAHSHHRAGNINPQPFMTLPPQTAAPAANAYGIAPPNHYPTIEQSPPRPTFQVLQRPHGAPTTTAPAIPTALPAPSTSVPSAPVITIPSTLPTIPTSTSTSIPATPAAPTTSAAPAAPTAAAIATSTTTPTCATAVTVDPTTITTTTVAAVKADSPVRSMSLQFGDVNLDIIKKASAAAKMASPDTCNKMADSNEDTGVPEKAPSPPPVQVPRLSSSPKLLAHTETDHVTCSKPSSIQIPKVMTSTNSTPQSTPTINKPADAPSPRLPPIEQAASQQNSGTTPVVNQKSPPASKPPSSWAGLFNKESTVVSHSDTVPEQPKSDTQTSVVVAEKPVNNELGAILADMKMSQCVVAIQPRRLINRANWCYINATLQALLACPPFYHMLKSLPAYPPLTTRRSVTPVLDAMVQLANEFNASSDRRRSKSEIKVDKPLEPTTIYDVLPKMKSAANSFQRGRQEDAEEFLTCLLNTLDEEIQEAVKLSKSTLSESKEDLANGHTLSDEDGCENVEDSGDSAWHQVGPKNKSVLTHSSHVDSRNVTLISTIFAGCLRSSLSTGTSKGESATLEPFFTVPLNVQTPKSIEEALQVFVCKEFIEGYTCPSTNQQTDAHRRLTFNQLPTILILHLKCFVYDKDGGSLKVNHKMEFKENLIFEKELLSPLAQKNLSKTEKSYKLFAVVYHYGEKTTGGHYHTDVFHTGERCWVRFDDDSVKRINLTQVFEKKQSCVPYLLYYKRMDSIPQHPSPNSSPSSQATHNLK